MKDYKIKPNVKSNVRELNGEIEAAQKIKENIKKLCPPPLKR